MPLNALTTLFSTLLVLVISSQSFADIILAEETFTQADGTLLADPGGTGFGGDFTGSVGGYTVTGGVLSGDDPLFRTFAGTFDSLAAANSTDTLYFSYDYQLSAITGNGFSGLSLFSGTTEQALIGRLGAGTEFRITDPSGADAPDSGVPINDGLRTVVLRLNLATDVIDLFVGANATDPVNVDTPTQSFGGPGSFDLGAVDQFRLQTNGNSVAEVDNIILGTTAAAVGAVTSVPEPSSAAILAFAGLGFARRRRN